MDFFDPESVRKAVEDAVRPYIDAMQQPSPEPVLAEGDTVVLMPDGTIKRVIDPDDDFAQEWTYFPMGDYDV
jgi:hypothetical protein